MCTKIAGAVPSCGSLQVLEFEVRASKNAEECPYPVDGRCPNPGTWSGGKRSTHSENDNEEGVTLEDRFRLAVELFADERGLR